jgi:hypothetical protein
MQQGTPPASDDEDPFGNEAITGLRREIAALRAEIAQGVRTRSLTVVDAEGFERIRLRAEDDHGSVSVSSRSEPGERTRAEMFALDGDGVDGAYVGVELIDRGNSITGYALYEGAKPRLWTDYQRPK